MKKILFAALLGSVLCGAMRAGALFAETTMPAGDAERGRQIFGPCRTCHYPEKLVGNHNGPSLYAIFGRKAGTREGFEYYSDTLKNAGFVWTPELLDVWLGNPGSFLPGTSMVFVGLPNPQDRADLIEYLKQFHD